MGADGYENSAAQVAPQMQPMFIQVGPEMRETMVVQAIPETRVDPSRQIVSSQELDDQIDFLRRKLRNSIEFLLCMGFLVGLIFLFFTFVSSAVVVKSLSTDMDYLRGNITLLFQEIEETMIRATDASNAVAAMTGRWIPVADLLDVRFQTERTIPIYEGGVLNERCAFSVKCGTMGSCTGHEFSIWGALADYGEQGHILTIQPSNCLLHGEEDVMFLIKDREYIALLEPREKHPPPPIPE